MFTVLPAMWKHCIKMALQTEWLKQNNIHGYMVLEAKIPNQGAGKAMEPLQALGTIILSLFPGFCSFSGS